MSSWLAMLQDAAEMFVFLAVELSLLFIVISAGVSLIRQKVPDHKIQQMMGARKGRGYLLAALLGAVTPFCSCSTIPMLRGLLSAKAGFGPTLTFLFVSPLLNPNYRRTNVDDLWLESHLVVRDYRSRRLRSCQYYPGFSGV